MDNTKLELILLKFANRVLDTQIRKDDVTLGELIGTPLKEIEDNTEKRVAEAKQELMDKIDRLPKLVTTENQYKNGNEIKVVKSFLDYDEIIKLNKQTGDSDE